MMPTLKPKNWPTFQHYKDRSPPWIKLHKGLLDDYEFQCLPVASRALAPMIWLLASESVNGEFDADLSKLAFRLHRTESEVAEGINPLIAKGFLIGAIDVLAGCKQDAMLETETETYKQEAEKRESKPRAKTAQGTRLPSDALLESEYVKAAMSTRPEWLYPKVQAVFEEFKDYWIAQPGAKGRKTDWIATWRNWCRREKGFNSNQQPSVQQERLNKAQQQFGAYYGTDSTVIDVTPVATIEANAESIGRIGISIR